MVCPYWIIAKDAPPLDSDDDKPLYSNDPYICCNACGRYVKRRCPRQQYCDNPDCQRLRKRRNQKDFYDRHKEKKVIEEKKTADEKHGFSIQDPVSSLSDR